MGTDSDDSSMKVGRQGQEAEHTRKHPTAVGVGGKRHSYFVVGIPKRGEKAQEKTGGVEEPKKKKRSRGADGKKRNSKKRLRRTKQSRGGRQQSQSCSFGGGGQLSNQKSDSRQGGKKDLAGERYLVGQTKGARYLRRNVQKRHVAVGRTAG